MMMNDDDNAEEQGAASQRSESSLALTRAIVGTRTRCKDLAFAIDAHDFEGVQNNARDAVIMWLTARAACRRLLTRVKEASPFSDAARRELEEHYMAILDLFGRAVATIAVPELRATLEGLRGMLTTAIALPLFESPMNDALPNQRKQRGRR
jgi:hypothetical protein